MAVLSMRECSPATQSPTIKVFPDPAPEPIYAFLLLMTVLGRGSKSREPDKCVHLAKTYGSDKTYLIQACVALEHKYLFDSF